MKFDPLLGIVPNAHRQKSFRRIMFSILMGGGEACTGMLCAEAVST
jgi:hypothetical protein